MLSPLAIRLRSGSPVNWVAINVGTRGPGAAASPSTSITAAISCAPPPPSGVASPSTPSSANPFHNACEYPPRLVVVQMRPGDNAADGHRECALFGVVGEVQVLFTHALVQRAPVSADAGWPIESNSERSAGNRIVHRCRSYSTAKPSAPES